MLPSEEYRKLSRVMNLCAAICGAGVISKNFRITFHTRFVFLNIVLFYIFSGYTAYVKMKDGFAAMIGSLFLIGKATQGLSKLCVCLILREECCSFHNKLSSIYNDYEVKGPNYRQVLGKCIERIQKASKVLLGLYVAGFGLATITPLILWFYDGRRTLPVPFEIPVFDVETTHGYVAVMSIQLLFIIFGAFGNFSGDLFFFTIATHFTLYADIFQLKTNELNELTDNPHDPNCLEMLINVLDWHQNFTKFVDQTDRTFFWINFTQVTTAGLSLILILILIVRNEWINAYTFICLEFSIMFMFCGMGTIVELANNDVCTHIYEIHWYKLSVAQQKIVKLMLMQSQSPKVLTVGGILPLSVNTGLQVTKTVYSVLMMLINLFIK